MADRIESSESSRKRERDESDSSSSSAAKDGKRTRPGTFPCLHAWVASTCPVERPPDVISFVCALAEGRVLPNESVPELKDTPLRSVEAVFTQSRLTSLREGEHTLTDLQSLSRVAWADANGFNRRYTTGDHTLFYVSSRFVAGALRSTITSARASTTDADRATIVELLHSYLAGIERNIANAPTKALAVALRTFFLSAKTPDVATLRELLTPEGALRAEATVAFLGKGRKEPLSSLLTALLTIQASRMDLTTFLGWVEGVTKETMMTLFSFHPQIRLPFRAAKHSYYKEDHVTRIEAVPLRDLEEGVPLLREYNHPTIAALEGLSDQILVLPCKEGCHRREGKAWKVVGEHDFISSSVVRSIIRTLESARPVPDREMREPKGKEEEVSDSPKQKEASCSEPTWN